MVGFDLHESEFFSECANNFSGLRLYYILRSLLSKFIVHYRVSSPPFSVAHSTRTIWFAYYYDS